jgi:hypothetical protein
MKDANSITVLTWTKNEQDIMPFFLRHYDFADHIIVWDNQSEDRTKEIVQACPKAELREWGREGVFDEIEHTRAKNEEYRQTGPGWKIVVDTDEFLWAPGGLRLLLTQCHEVDITLVTADGYDMVAQEMPADDGHSQLLSLVREGVRSPRYDKAVCFKRCVDMHYDHGCHSCHSGNPVKVTETKQTKLLHFRFLGLERVIGKTRWLGGLFDPAQQKMGLGTEATDVEWQRRRWNYLWENRKAVI